MNGILISDGKGILNSNNQSISRKSFSRKHIFHAPVENSKGYVIAIGVINQLIQFNEVISKHFPQHSTIFISYKYMKLNTIISYCIERLFNDLIEMYPDMEESNVTIFANSAFGFDAISLASFFKDNQVYVVNPTHFREVLDYVYDSIPYGTDNWYHSETTHEKCRDIIELYPYMRNNVNITLFMQYFVKYMVTVNELHTLFNVKSTIINKKIDGVDTKKTLMEFFDVNTL